MLFTHFGVSGPLVLSASCHMKPDKTGSLEGYCLFIDLKPGLSHSQLDARILRDFEQFINKDFINSLGQLLPRKAIQPVAILSGIPFETKNQPNYPRAAHPTGGGHQSAARHPTVFPTD